MVGAGKAAARMAAGVEEVLGAQRLRGLVIVPEGCEVTLDSVGMRLASHPVPDERGAAATAELCALLTAATEGPVLCVISGGASSLLVRPRQPVTLAEKMEANHLLLTSGADIGEINTVRKHLSTVKGGGLLRHTSSRPMITLALSDVIGDDPSIIGSGPTVPDRTTFADACGVLDRYALVDRVAPAVRDLLKRGMRGDVAETVKPADSEAAGAEYIVIGDNHSALTAAADEARRLGYEPLLEMKPLEGDTSTVAQRWMLGVRDRVAGRRCCAIVGGETTGAVRGGGRGGRNQEFALALVRPMNRAAMAVLSAGTDGIDGPTDAAGAFVDGNTLTRALAVGLDPNAALASNDSYSFFDRLDDLLRCGATGTNVMDIKLAVGLPSST